MKEDLIENPKVFISYAWGIEEYQQQVLDFAGRLKGDGIEVIIDKWNLDVGNDTFAFMEKCIKDSSINFVIILLDEIYAKKADDRTGGVGTETQIISPKVYDDIEQNKFVPVVFARNTKGEICKPTYLNSRYHFDLTIGNIEQEYIKLVRFLYGRKIYVEPPLGKKPAWVDSPKNITPITFSEINILKNRSSVITNRKELIINALDKIYQNIQPNIVNIKEVPQEITKVNAQWVIEYKKKFVPIRDLFLDLLDIISSEKDCGDYVVDFFERIYNECLDAHPNEFITKEIIQSLIHELFIYTIAKYWRIQSYDKIYSLVTRTYFISNSYGSKAVNFNEIFYSTNFQTINWVKNKIDYPNDEKFYHSGEAQLWVETLNEKYTKEDFVFSDLLLHNLSILLFPKVNWHWFPKTYIYFTYPSSRQFLKFSISFKSKYQINRLLPLLSLNNIESLKEMFNNMQTIKDDPQERYRYQSCYERADLILDHITIDEIGSLA